MEARQFRQHSIGPLVLVAATVVFNSYAARTGKPTISTSIRWISKHSTGAWIAGGVIGGLLAHWFLESENSFES